MRRVLRSAAGGCRGRSGSESGRDQEAGEILSKTMRKDGTEPVEEPPGGVVESFNFNFAIDITGPAWLSSGRKVSECLCPHANRCRMKSLIAG